MDRIEEFRRQAERADDFAARTPDPKMRRLFTQIAAQWRELARQLELADTLPKPPSR